MPLKLSKDKIKVMVWSLTDLTFVKMTYLKHCVGIDISKNSFTACLCSLSDKQELSFSVVREFNNDSKGFNQLNRWVNKTLKSNQEIVYLMEATGVYYEKLAYHLVKIKKTVHVCLPNKSKHYFSSLNIKSKTDMLDAKVLSQFGAERKHLPWIPPKSIYRDLRGLTRYYTQLQEQKTILGNIKHSKEESFEVPSFILKSNKKLIKSIDDQINKLKIQIKELINSDQELKEKVDKILTIKGLGLITIATVVGETFGFEQFENIKQLVSYSGYDVVQRESGTSIKGKTRISKKGNRYIRKALYFPAMVACRYNENLKNTYIRIIQNKPSKMVGQVAIQRKLLVLIYTLWKNDTCYDLNYKNKVAPDTSEATLNYSRKNILEIQR